jgi:deoxyribodipyrimidine photo-lyase
MLGHALNKKYDALPWITNKKFFDCWKKGHTGFPIVDAGMRELNATGFMHNRVRMIVASFLTKDLHINWKEGERYFAQQLIDYDPAVNNGNWQWSASTGIDAQPYFRIFNPWLQQKKFDPYTEYIKKWIPELASQDPKIIHTWYKQVTTKCAYPLPIVDHSQESAQAKQQYKNIL